MTTAAPPTAPLSGIRRQTRLVFDLARRSIFSRYRDTVLGVAWSVVFPLVLLAIYAFVFSAVFEARWEVDSGDEVSFAVILFSGLILFNFFNESMNNSTAVVANNAQLIKRTSVASLVLPLSVVAAALINFALSLVPFVAGYLLMVGLPPLTAVWFPVTFLPLIVLSAGVALLIAASSVYIRDVQQLSFLFTTFVLFTSPIFYPESAIPAELRKYVDLSPLSVPLSESKAVLFNGTLPDWERLVVYTVVAALVATFGAFVFRKAEKGFADVL